MTSQMPTLEEQIDAQSRFLLYLDEKKTPRESLTYVMNAAILASLRRLSTQNTEEWLPIESAPRDGSLIWVANEHSMRIASWSENRWRDFHGEYPRLDVLFTPTHWMPKPSLPTIVSRDVKP